MIVTTGKMIRIECGYEGRYEMYRDSEKPGIVVLKNKKAENGEAFVMNLPGHPQDAQRLIDAYIRIVNEPVEYKTSNVE